MTDDVDQWVERLFAELRQISTGPWGPKRRFIAQCQLQLIASSQSIPRGWILTCADHITSEQ